MADWTAGYVADINYTYGYYPELNPLRARAALLHAGLVPPQAGTACELGYGQGLSVNIHAAASGAHWHGTDFNPAQAAFAQELAAASGAGARLYDDAFADFAQRPDLPGFDYIGLHGIWSWISDANRQAIVDVIKNKLNVGGVLYISYNTLPGWAAFAPMRHLLTRHADMLGAAGQGIVHRIDEALHFADQLLAVNPLFSRVNPQTADRLKNMRQHDRHYLAHEYFNRDWLPMHFADMAHWLEGAKLQYACSAHYPDHIDALNLTAEQQAFLKDIPDAMFRETVRDFMVNQQFRRDYWVKGARTLSPAERAEALHGQRVLLTTRAPDISLKAKGALGEGELNAAVYTPILTLLADHKIKTLGQIAQGVAQQGVDFNQVVQAAMVLIGTGHLAPAQDDDVIAKAKKRTDRLNACLCRKARTGNDIRYLASPVTGGGVGLNRFQQLFLSALAQGGRQPDQWALFTWQILSAQGQKLLKDGNPLETKAENLAELTAQAQTFAAQQLPILKALQIA